MLEVVIFAELGCALRMHPSNPSLRGKWIKGTPWRTLKHFMLWWDTELVPAWGLKKLKQIVTEACSCPPYLHDRRSHCSGARLHVYSSWGQELIVCLTVLGPRGRESWRGLLDQSALTNGIKPASNTRTMESPPSFQDSQAPVTHLLCTFVKLKFNILRNIFI